MFCFLNMAVIIGPALQKNNSYAYRPLRRIFMKIAVMSDSHDNIWKLRKALGIIQSKNCEKIIHCGDFVAPFMFKELVQGGHLRPLRVWQ